MVKNTSICTLSINIFLCALSVSGQKPFVDSLINKEMNKLHIPGFEAAAIKNGKILWAGYYGYQNVETKTPVTGKTLFDIASCSKTITAAAVMQLYAQRKLRMDDDINRYLDFKITNPKFPNQPITFRQLLRHRSSINDNEEYLGQFWETNNGDPAIALGTFLKNYLSPGGKHYDKTKNFYDYPPNSHSHYSNIGIALLGYLIERISGQPFKEYCKTRLFQPLAMTHTGWFLADVDTSTLAMCYRYSDSLKQYQALGFSGFPDYPAGSLKTNVAQLSHFLIAWTQNGKWNNRQVFDSSSIQTLTPDDFNLGFHLWFLYGTDKGSLLYYHTGRANGISSFIAFNPVSKQGLIFLSNGEWESKEGWRELIDTLYDNVF